DTKVRNPALPCDLRRLHHAARAAVAESPRHQHAVRIVEEDGSAGFLERLPLDPLDVHLEAVGESAVVERLVETLVRVFVPDVLPDHVNGETVGGMRDA